MPAGHEDAFGCEPLVDFRTQRTVETLQTVDSTVWGRQASRIDEMKQSLAASEKRLATIDDLLFAGDAAVAPDELRRRIDASGLAASIQDGRWQSAEGLAGEQQIEAVLAIRDEAVQPVMVEAARTVKSGTEEEP